MRVPSIGIAALLAATIADPAFAATKIYTITGKADGVMRPLVGDQVPFSNLPLTFTGSGDTAQIRETRPGVIWKVSLPDFSLTLDGVSYDPGPAPPSTTSPDFSIFGNFRSRAFGFQYTDNFDFFSVTAPNLASSTEFELETNFGPLSVSFISGLEIYLEGGGSIFFNNGTDLLLTVSGSDVAPVPAPASMLLLGAGLLGLAAARARRG